MTEPKAGAERELSPLEQIEAKRAARKGSTQKALDAQRLIDLTAIDALEEEHGDSRVAVVHLPYTAGLPSAVAAKAPTPGQVKRYRDQIKTRKDGTQGDYNAAVELVCASCLVYPDAETFAALAEKRPGIAVQLGLAALKLAAGLEEQEGKG